jgi:hypothetical protein
MCEEIMPTVRHKLVKVQGHSDDIKQTDVKTVSGY